MRIYGPESRYGRRLRWWERWLWQLGRELKKNRAVHGGNRGGSQEQGEDWSPRL